jgi:hypothetical protein
MTRLHLSAVAVAAAITVFATGGSMAAAAPPPLPNLVRNGSFEHPRIRAGSTAAFASIPGWRLAFGPAIEIQNHVAGAAAVGDQLVELDSDASSGIYQRIPTRPNRLYRIQFFFSPRPGTSAAENVLVVKWHRRVVATLRADGTGLADTDWRMYAIKVRATGRTTRLELDDAGISDSVGTLIDGVTVTRWRGHPTGGA